MDRQHEPSTPFVEYPATCQLTAKATARAWRLPLPVRVKYTGLRDMGLKAPCEPKQRNQFFTLTVKGTPHILTYPGPKHWLVTAFSFGETPTDLFAGEQPIHRVDGLSCKLSMAYSSHGTAYMADVDIDRATIGPMTTRVLDREPDSRILVRLTTRCAYGVVRWFEDTKHIQFWAAI
jgi:hypothetical protein